MMPRALWALPMSALCCGCTLVTELFVFDPLPGHDASVTDGFVDAQESPPESGIDAGAEAAAEDVVEVDASDASNDASSDAGALSWSFLRPPTSRTLRGIWGSAEGSIWIVGDGSTILRWDGVSWVVESAPEANLALRDIWGTSATSLWAVGSDSLGNCLVIRSDGAAWTRDRGLVCRGSMRTIWGSSERDVWVVGSTFDPDSNAWRYDGVSWHAQRIGMRPGDVASVHGTSASDVWITTEQGSAFHFDGVSWLQTASRAPGIGLETALWVVGPDDFWASGFNGAVYRYTPLGWAIASTGVGVPMRRFHATGVNSLWGVGPRGAVIRSGNGRWQAVGMLGPMNLNDVWGLTDSDLWVVGDFGTVARGRR
ncbi:MAG: hypothetical protein Q8Q09_23705 [Deltaproteobacteria bacterium]|nr:hypothetical protein [Deltaproteobacteria bacterium]